MKIKGVLTALALTATINLCAFASPVQADVKEENPQEATLASETVNQSVSGEVDINLSELFVVRRGNAIPSDDEVEVVQKVHPKTGRVMWHVNLYLEDKNETVLVPVLAQDGEPDIVVDGKLSDDYNNGYCKYTLYTSGIYVLERSAYDGVIVSLSLVGVDENGKYRAYYEVLDPYKGTKYVDVVGSNVYDKASDVVAFETGLVVYLKNGVIYENVVPAGKIDTTDASAGLVWISEFNTTDNTMTVVPMYVTQNVCCKDGYTKKLGEYSFDAENPDVDFNGKAYSATAEGKIQYKITDNTVVSILEYSNANTNAAKWGSIKLGGIDEIAEGNKNYKCYNDKYEALDGNYTTKYAHNVAAYVFGEKLADGTVAAEVIMVVVNELPDNQNGMFNVDEACNKHEDVYKIDSLEKLDGENGKFSYKMSVSNISHTGSVLLMICTYDDDGVLINAYIKTSTAAAGQTDTFTTVEITDGDRKAAFAKAFVFDTENVLSPLAKSVEK